MSNPVATIGNDILDILQPVVERKTFAKVVYDSANFFTYANGEYGSYSPAGKGEQYCIFVQMSDALSGAGGQPSFVSDSAWKNSTSGDDSGLKSAASAFVTAANSVMPKVIIPSTMLVDNGIKTTHKNSWARYNDSGTWKDLFNWELLTDNGTPIAAGTEGIYAKVAGNHGTNFVSVFGSKDDTYADNIFKMKLENPASPPLGSAHGWLKDNSSDLVVGGACVILLSMMPYRSYTKSGSDSEPAQVGAVQNASSVTIEFGEVKIVVQPSGETTVSLGNTGGGEKNTMKVDLAEGRTKNGPPQQEYMVDKSPFVILCYPIWNGIVVASGVQDSNSVVATSSHLLKKTKDADILDSTYSLPFRPDAPAAIRINAKSTYYPEVNVDFGTTATVTGRNCHFEIAYLPCFFSKEGWFDEYQTLNTNMPGFATYQYKVYPIWTKGGDDLMTLSPMPSAPTDTGAAGDVANTNYYKTRWHMHQDAFNRRSGEIFGSYLETIQTLMFPIKNFNGSFNLNWTGGTPGDSASTGNWRDYVQSINVTTNLDGSSGSITVDKYGVAGQLAEAIQSIGAITINASGGYGTDSDTPFFYGFGMGIQDTRSTGDGGTWTIPLIGLEKKLDDIAMLFTPIMDGELFVVAGNFLCKYAGLDPDYTWASLLTPLGVSDDINVVRFDWKAGTTVRTALEEVVADTLHHYVVMRGKIFFYELDGFTGLPSALALGPDWSPNYPTTKIIMYDAAPDFEDMRNQIFVFALQQMPEGRWAEIQGLPTFLRQKSIQQETIPDIPWARTLVKSTPGYLDQTKIDLLANRLAIAARKYELIGKTTIPGNGRINPYDRWGDMIIFGVTHNLDFRNKTWTTDLEFMRSAAT